MPRTRAAFSPACAAGCRCADCAERARLRPGAGAFLGSAHVAGGELIAGRLLSPVEVGAAFAGAGSATRPRIEESESLPS